MVKLFVLGIDGAFPEYIFGEWLDELPNIKKLILEGSFAKMNSTIPPLSVVAWSTIYTGKSPADTGIFEYVYRKDFSYDDIHIVSSKNLHEKTIWQIASENKQKSIVCFVNLTWPIVPFNGILIGDPLAPSGESVRSIYPEELKNELKEAFGEIPPANLSMLREDTTKSNFREMEKESIIQECYKLTERHIESMKYLIEKKEWNLFFGIIGLSDRMNHAFWKYMDKEHRAYDPNSQFKNVLKDYYKFVDAKFGELIEILDKDTKIIVLSDHGITRMHTRVNLTDWLIREGYMVLKEPIREKCEFKLSMVNWEKTRAFAIGAYEGQIFINLKGREPKGIVEEKDSDKLLGELSYELKKIKGDDGKILDTKIFKKKDYFLGKCENVAPDMIIYFDNLQYGCNTTLMGNETLWSPNTARGSDDAAHSRQGIFIMKNNKSQNKNMGEVNAIDIAPTILNELGIIIPQDMKGKVIN